MNDILMVGDEPDNLSLVQCILELEEMTVHCVASAEEALPLIKNGNFSLMITDLNMPKLNGLELARKALKSDPCMPVIMITGDRSLENLRLAAYAGINKILAKPFSPDEILEAVREMVGVARKRGSSAVVLVG